MPQVKIKQEKRVASSSVSRMLLQEIRMLRHELSLLIPEDRLEDYAHPERIKNSFQNALKKYPVHSSIQKPPFFLTLAIAKIFTAD